MGLYFAFQLYMEIGTTSLPGHSLLQQKGPGNEAGFPRRLVPGGIETTVPRIDDPRKRNAHE